MEAFKALKDLNLKGLSINIEYSTKFYDGNAIPDNFLKPNYLESLVLARGKNDQLLTSLANQKAVKRVLMHVLQTDVSQIQQHFPVIEDLLVSDYAQNNWYTAANLLSLKNEKKRLVIQTF